MDQHLPTLTSPITPDTPALLVLLGPATSGQSPSPYQGKNVWRLCKTYGRIIGYPMLKPYDLRHGDAMEILEAHHDLEAVRAMLGHTGIDTTQTYTRFSVEGIALRT